MQLETFFIITNSVLKSPNPELTEPWMDNFIQSVIFKKDFFIVHMVNLRPIPRISLIYTLESFSEGNPFPGIFLICGLKQENLEETYTNTRRTFEASHLGEDFPSNNGACESRRHSVGLEVADQ